jgi:hypothetical protein
MSPLNLQVFLPCFAGSLLFVAGVVVGRTLPTAVIVGVNQKQASDTLVTTHGRFGAPRWIQQPTLVAAADASLPE